MLTIRKLIEKDYTLFNVNAMGERIDRYGHVTDKQTEFNLKSTMWGIQLGQHRNGKWLMSLHCDATQSYFKEIHRILDDEDGLFLTETKDIYTLLIDYTACDEIKAIGPVGGLFRFDAQVIPPSKLVTNGFALQEREWMGEGAFHILEEGSHLYDFILETMKIQKKIELEQEILKQFESERLEAERLEKERLEEEQRQIEELKRQEEAKKIKWWTDSTHLWIQVPLISEKFDSYFKQL